MLFVYADGGTVFLGHSKPNQTRTCLHFLSTVLMRMRVNTGIITQGSLNERYDILVVNTEKKNIPKTG